MDFEKEFTKFLGIPGVVIGFLIGIWKFFKFFLNRSLIEIENRIKNIEKDFDNYKKTTDSTIKLIISRDKEIEIKRCMFDIEHIIRDIEDNRKQIGAMWERIEKENKEVNKELSHIKGYMEGKKEK